MERSFWRSERQLREPDGEWVKTGARWEAGVAPVCVGGRQRPPCMRDAAAPPTLQIGHLLSVLVVERGRCERGSLAGMDADETGHGWRWQAGTLAVGVLAVAVR